jgi:formate/nitrite transporter FocA (FNT family)
MYIAIGGLLSIIVGDGIIVPGQPGWHSLAFGAVFPLGLVLVIIAGSSLFTGNVMIMTIGVLTKT